MRYFAHAIALDVEPVFLNDYVLLASNKILTKDEAWINRANLLDRFEESCTSVQDDQLCTQAVKNGARD